MAPIMVAMARPLAWDECVEDKGRSLAPSRREQSVRDRFDPDRIAGRCDLEHPGSAWHDRADDPHTRPPDTMNKATKTNNKSPAPQPAADSHDRIRVHGARVNNLKDISI
jgi:hypothetical protein